MLLDLYLRSAPRFIFKLLCIYCQCRLFANPCHFKITLKRFSIMFFTFATSDQIDCRASVDVTRKKCPPGRKNRIRNVYVNRWYYDSVQQVLHGILVFATNMQFKTSKLQTISRILWFLSSAVYPPIRYIITCSLSIYTFSVILVRQALII